MLISSQLFHAENNYESLKGALLGSGFLFQMQLWLGCFISNYVHTQSG